MTADGAADADGPRLCIRDWPSPALAAFLHMTTSTSWYAQAAAEDDAALEEAEQEQEAEATEKPQVNRKTPPLASTTSSFMERQRSMQLPNAQTTEAGT